MADEPIGGVTVDTSALEGGVPPASQQESAEPQAPPQTPEAEGRTTEQGLPSVEELQEQLSRERAAREKAEKAFREQERRRMQAENENRKARERVLETVEGQLKAMNDRLDQGEALTMEELRRRDQLIEQRIELRLNAREAQEHESRRAEYGSKLYELATKELGLDESAYSQFLARHAVPTLNPVTGQVELAPFGNYTDPAQAFEAAKAFLHYETRDQYETKVRQTETEKADQLAREKLRRAIPGGQSVKPQPPPDPHAAYKAAIMQVGKQSDPDSWF